MTALDLADADPDAQPVHVARFGVQIDAKGVLAGSPDTDRQRAHLDRLWAELRHTPCSERCANWLLYGVQPKHARPGLKPGNCKAKVHKRGTLGIGGRRVLISRQWSGKTLADHKADRRDFVRQLLGVTSEPGDDQDGTEPSPQSRHVWEMARPDDPDVLPLGHRLLRAVSERIRHLRTRPALSCAASRIGH